MRKILWIIYTGIGKAALAVIGCFVVFDLSLLAGWILKGFKTAQVQDLLLQPRSLIELPFTGIYYNLSLLIHDLRIPHSVLQRLIASHALTEASYQSLLRAYTYNIVRDLSLLIIIGIGIFLFERTKTKTLLRVGLFYFLVVPLIWLIWFELLPYTYL